MDLADIFANPEHYAKFAQPENSEKKNRKGRAGKPIDDPSLQKEIIGILVKNIHGLTALEIKKRLGTKIYTETTFVEEGPIGKKKKIEVVVRKSKDRFTTAKVVANLEILASREEILFEKNGETRNVGRLKMYGDRNFCTLVITAQ